eukprot:1160836-Pelagomonas_calceolata.AAC.2
MMHRTLGPFSTGYTPKPEKIYVGPDIQVSAGASPYSVKLEAAAAVYTLLGVLLSAGESEYCAVVSLTCTACQACKRPLCMCVVSAPLLLGVGGLGGGGGQRGVHNAH